MEEKLVSKGLMLVSVAGFLLMSVTFLLMPWDMVQDGGVPAGFNIILGSCFWLGLVAGCVAQFALSRQRKRRSEECGLDEYIREHSGRGIASFFKNRLAMVCDVFLAIGLVGFVVAIVMTNATGYICYVFLALLAFSFCMHCILNGKNFYCIVNREQLLRIHQSKKHKAKDSKREKRHKGGNEDVMDLSKEESV